MSDNQFGRCLPEVEQGRRRQMELVWRGSVRMRSCRSIIRVVDEVDDIETHQTFKLLLQL